MLEIAQALARSGVYVHPCAAAGDQRKKPLHPWRRVSTCDVEAVERLWRSNPTAVPGIDAGKSGFVIIDADRKPNAPDGVAAFEALAFAAEDDLAGVPYVDTPSGGRHYYFRNDPTAPFTNARGALPKGVDVRGDGGFVIGPGAALDVGTYRHHGPPLSDAPPVPAWLAAILRPAAPPVPPAPREPVPASSDARLDAYLEAAIEAELGKLRGAVPGERNETLNAVTFALATIPALTDQQITSFVEPIALGIGLTASEVRKTIASAIRGGRAKPREWPPRATERELVTFRGEPVLIRHPDGTITDEDGVIVKEAPTPPQGWTNAGGLIGDIADWIMLTSRRPNRPLAVAAAVATISTLLGRHLYAPTGTALNLYIVTLAETAVGKGRPISAISELLTACGYSSLHTTLKAFSVSAIEKMIVEKPCVCATSDEIGANFLARMSHKRASTHESAMKAALLELWSRVRGQAPFSTTRSAAVAPVEIHAPHLTLYGASTDEAFYSSVSSGAVEDGFLNRFLLVKAAPRAASREVEDADMEVPDHIRARLAALVPALEGGNIAAGAGVFSAVTAPRGRRAPWACEATKTAARDLEEAILTEADNATPEARKLSGRVFEYSMRLATIHAVSRAGIDAVVTREDLDWGAGWARDSAARMLDGVRNFMHATDYEAKLNAIRTAISEAGQITQMELLRKVRSVGARERDEIIKHLVEARWIEPVTIKTGGRDAKGFRRLND